MKENRERNPERPPLKLVDLLQRASWPSLLPCPPPPKPLPLDTRPPLLIAILPSSLFPLNSSLLFSRPYQSFLISYLILITSLNFHR